LAIVNGYSTKNRFTQPLKELGNAVSTTDLLEWIIDESLRRPIYNVTSNIERHHKFANRLAIDAGGHHRSNVQANQEKAIVYNELVANAVALENVVEQTLSRQALKSKGVSIRPSDLALLIQNTSSKLKRFGEYPTVLTGGAMPTRTTLPL